MRDCRTLLTEVNPSGRRMDLGLRIVCIRFVMNVDLRSIWYLPQFLFHGSLSRKYSAYASIAKFLLIKPPITWTLKYPHTLLGVLQGRSGYRTDAPLGVSVPFENFRQSHHQRKHFNPLSV